MNIFIVVLFIIIIIIIIICTIITYGFYSGSCYRNMQNYTCTTDFCLIKKIKVELPNNIKKNIIKLIHNENNKKRVVIKPFVNLESIFGCAIPSKSSSTIATQVINTELPELIKYYKNELCNIISQQINIELKPTLLNFPTTCSILMYEQEGDWINWHYDYNYYNGRFFTVLIPITTDITCTKYQYKINNVITQLDLINDAIIFEGNYLYHNASKLCKNEKRYILSLQYVTDNTISYVNSLRIKLKDYAYIGKIK